MRTDARAYGPDDEIIRWQDADLTVEPDGEIVRIEGLEKGWRNKTWAWGPPGVSLEVTPRTAVRLALALLDATPTGEDIRFALGEYIEEVNHLLRLPDYDASDRKRMRTRQKRLAAVLSRS